MRKLSLVMAALALVLGLSQCKKENKSVANGEKQRIVLTADNGNDGSKVSAQFVSETLNLTWDGDETITVTGGAETEDGKPLAFKDGKDSNSATFEGDINVVDESELFTFTVGGTPDYLHEDGGKEGLETWIHDNISLTGTTNYQQTGRYSVNMKLPYAVLKLSVSAFVGTAKDSPTPLTITVGNEKIVEVTDVTSLTEVFVAVPADGVKKDYIISCNGKTATKSWTLEPDIFYTKDDGNGGGTGAAIVIEPDAPVVPEGALSGVFSVDPNKKVYFSKGNLQYIGSATTPYWKFADYQYTYLGKQASTAANINRDLFGWGTSGISTGENRLFLPWETSNTSSSYGPASVNLSVEGNSDWGVNSIQIKGQGETGWYTLSIAEWEYLLNSRTGNRYAKAKVNDVNGLLIFPDDYTLPEGYNQEGGTGMSAVNVSNAAYPDANIGETTWQNMGRSVAFLPAGGYRYTENGGSASTTYSSGNSIGYYWSTTRDSNNSNAKELKFSGSEVVVNTDKTQKRNGLSVRLVKNVLPAN